MAGLRLIGAIINFFALTEIIEISLFDFIAEPIFINQARRRLMKPGDFRGGSGVLNSDPFSFHRLWRGHELLNSAIDSRLYV